MEMYDNESWMNGVVMEAPRIGGVYKEVSRFLLNDVAIQGLKISLILSQTLPHCPRIIWDQRGRNRRRISSERATFKDEIISYEHAYNYARSYRSSSCALSAYVK